MTGVTLLGPLGRRSCYRSYSRDSRYRSHRSYSRIAPFGLGTAPFRSSNVTGRREGPNIRNNSLPTATTALTGRRMRPCLSTVDAFCTEISTGRSQIRALSCPIDYRFPSLIPQCLLRAASDTFRDINGCRMVTLPTRITCHRKCHFLEQ